MGGLRVVAMALLGCDNRSNQSALCFHHADRLADSSKLLPLLRGDLLLRDWDESEPLSPKSSALHAVLLPPFNLDLIWPRPSVFREGQRGHRAALRNAFCSSKWAMSPRDMQ